MPKQLYKASASFCYHGDSVEAIADEILPKNSNDHSIARHTFWPHKGTSEWYEAEFNEPRTVQSVGAYWFDDTGRGGCRVPESWKVLLQVDGQWEPAALLSGCGYETARDRLNRVRFEARKTAAVRVEVQLQEGFSGGVLELVIE